MSPISSRKRVPPSACSNLPARSANAPVKEPFMWPNSSLSISSDGIAAQLTSTNGLLPPRRGVVQRPRDQLLAGAVLAGDQHPRSRRRRPWRSGPGRPAAPGSSPPSGSGSPTASRSRAFSPTSSTWASALRTVSRRRSVSSGFSRKSNAPRCVASTAVAIVPWPRDHDDLRTLVELAQPGAASRGRPGPPSSRRGRRGADGTRSTP